MSVGPGAARSQSSAGSRASAEQRDRVRAEDRVDPLISENTAGVHVSNILGKLGVAGRGEAAALAYRLGLVEPASEPA